MKTELNYKTGEDWIISIEPESEIERCAFNYLSGRPTNQVKIVITKLGLFERRENG